MVGTTAQIARWIGAGTAAVLALLLLGCAAPIACPTVALEQAKPPQHRDPLVPVLQRRIHEREKRIAELQIQLDTLKHIETDVRTDKKMNSSQ
jgi:hypothetical protein